VIYLDTSALVKLIRIEVESEALGDWLDERTEMRWITSASTPVAQSSIAPISRWRRYRAGGVA